MSGRGHRYGEAFMLMQYRCAAGGHRETIWNSRDGVTPFMIGCATCGGDAQHVDWRGDVYAPDHKPKPGDRIFVNLTRERALEYRRSCVERWWGPEMRECYGSKKVAIRELAEADLAAFAPDTSDLIVVPEVAS